MKTAIFTFVTAMILFAATSLSAQRSFLSNYGISVNAGLSGIGGSISTPLHRNFNLRAGYEFPAASYTYTATDLGDVEVAGEYIPIPSTDLNAKLNGSGFHVLIDYTPFKRGMGAFHLTGGLYSGDGQLVTVTGQFDKAWMDAYNVSPADLSVEIGDSRVSANPDGSISAYAKVRSLKPYVGLGWGNAIPKGRLGFRFDMGVMLHGKPSIESPNLVGGISANDDLDSFNKMIGEVSVWPQLSFQLTYRLIKENRFRK